MPRDLDHLQDLDTLNARFEADPAGAIAHAVSGPLGPTALVSSFGADSAVLLHMVARIDRHVPVIFIDTLLLFPETVQYHQDLVAHFGFTDVRRTAPDRVELFLEDPELALHGADPDACCSLRKARPLERALAPFDSWISGRKRFQSGLRAGLQVFEADPVTGMVKINPLAGYSADDLRGYMDRHALPRHPLVARGYPSIGCTPCTSAVAAGEDPRAGRWRGREKTECGIHFGQGFAAAAPPATGVVVTDRGFDPDRPGAHWTDLPPETDPEALRPRLAAIDAIRIEFPAFSDGRGFTLAARLRRMGFAGRLRARGHVIADQYAMIRRAGFDEVEIDATLAARQPEAQWLARADWQSHDHRRKLGRRTG